MTVFMTTCSVIIVYVKRLPGCVHAMQVGMSLAVILITCVQYLACNIQNKSFQHPIGCWDLVESKHFMDSKK